MDDRQNDVNSLFEHSHRLQKQSVSYRWKDRICFISISVLKPIKTSANIFLDLNEVSTRHSVLYLISFIIFLITFTCSALHLITKPHHPLPAPIQSQTDINGSTKRVCTILTALYNPFIDIIWINIWIVVDSHLVKQFNLIRYSNIGRV